MSEFLQIQQRRREDLLQFSLGMMAGQNGKELIARYKDAIEHVTPHDIIAMEDKQVQMGVSPKQIKQHIEKILNVLNPHLSKYPWEKPTPPNPIHYMMEENRALEQILNEMKEPIKRIELHQGDDLDIPHEMARLRQYIEKLQEFNKHYIRKENILFPFLEKKWQYHAPLRVMWSLHDDIRDHWKTLATLLRENERLTPEINRYFAGLFLLMYRMVFKEEKIVFPVAMETLSENDWREILIQSAEVGYAYIDSPTVEVHKTNAIGGYAPKDTTVPTFAEQELPIGQVLLGLDTGVLDLERLLLLLNALPLDITYVDENDRVKYFSNTKDRIFPRSPAIIGRTVQNCHPPESVHKVNDILQAFRAGEKDQAKFWIQLHGKFIVIEYFALRDHTGRYKGTLEVSQDVTEIRNLTGERRLLDWEQEE